MKVTKTKTSGTKTLDKKIQKKTSSVPSSAPTSHDKSSICETGLFTEHNIWKYEVSFFVIVFVMLAVVRRYTTYLKAHPGKVFNENLGWALSSFIIVLWSAYWRKLCQPQLVPDTWFKPSERKQQQGKHASYHAARQEGTKCWQEPSSKTSASKASQLSSHQAHKSESPEKIYFWETIMIGLIVAVGAFLICYLVEIGGINTIVYLHARKKSKKTVVDPDYEDAVESWGHTTFFGLTCLFGFMFMVCFIYLYTCHRKGFLRHYFSPDETIVESPSTNILINMGRWIYNRILKFVWNLMVKMIMLMINVIVLIIYFISGVIKLPSMLLPSGKDAWKEFTSTMGQGIANIGQLLVNIGSMMVFFIWGLITSPFSSKCWESLDGAMFCPKDIPEKNVKDTDRRNEKICFTGGCISNFLGYEGGSLMTSWIIYLVVGGLIFAAPIILVVKNRLEFNSHEKISLEEAVLHNHEVHVEVVLLMLKYVVVFGIKMMIEYYLWKLDHPQVAIK